MLRASQIVWSTVARGVMEAEGNKKKQRNIDKINGEREIKKEKDIRKGGR